MMIRRTWLIVPILLAILLLPAIVSAESEAPNIVIVDENSFYYKADNGKFGQEYLYKIKFYVDEETLSIAKSIRVCLNTPEGGYMLLEPNAEILMSQGSYSTFLYFEGREQKFIRSGEPVEFDVSKDAEITFEVDHEAIEERLENLH